MSDRLEYVRSESLVADPVVFDPPVVAPLDSDPTATEGDWSAVEITPKKAIAVPVTLAQCKADKKLAAFGLVKKSRISVVPATPEEFARVLELGKTKL